MNDTPAYGLWSLVLLNSLVFIIFAFSFTACVKVVVASIVKRPSFLASDARG